MRRRRPTGLRARLLAATAVGTLLAVGALVTVFNLVLDAQLRGDVSSVLRERAAAQLRTLSVLNGRLQVPEALDQASRDTQTWIFVADRVYEQPSGAGGNDHAALMAASGPNADVTVAATGTRLHAVPIVAGARRLGTLVVGASLLPYQRSAHTALTASLVLAALSLLGVGVLATWLIGRALAPVSRIAADAAGWQEHEPMRRFYAGEPHDELTELAATFDGLLTRLSASLQREKRFTAEISHELRTPLAAIVAEAELALSHDQSRPGQRAALSTILASAEHLEAALEALLTAARSGANEASHPVSARVVADRVVQLVGLAGDRTVTVDVGPAPPELHVAAEAALAERALMPIVDNATRFARRSVRIGVGQDDGQVVFEVSDDGPGVAEHVRERVFEPGFSFADAAGRSGSGAGLGLALARRLARAAGGDVQCVSVPQGARFELRLPAPARGRGASPRPKTG